jgi:hypothetical protein
MSVIAMVTPTISISGCPARPFYALPMKALRA